MKYIVVGLGNFGASLALKNSQLKKEVIGIDTRMAKVDLYKERTHTPFVWMPPMSLQYLAYPLKILM